MAVSECAEVVKDPESVEDVMMVEVNLECPSSGIYNIESDQDHKTAAAQFSPMKIQIDTTGSTENIKIIDEEEK